MLLFSKKLSQLTFSVQKRFTNAVSQTLGALNSIIADVKTGVGLVGDKDQAFLTMGMLMGLSVAQTVVGKVVDAA